MNKTLSEYKSSITVPPWMISLEEQRSFTKGTVGLLGVAALGLATRIGITLSTIDSSSPLLSRIVETTSQHILGLAQQLGLYAHSPGWQITEVVAGLLTLSGLTVAGGKLVDNLRNKSKLKELIEKTRTTIIETGNITEILPIVGHSILVSPQGLPFINALAPLLDNCLLVTESYDPYDPGHKVRGESVFPLFIKTDHHLHDEEVFDHANADHARSLVIVPQSAEQLVFFDSAHSTEKGLLSLVSAHRSLSPGKNLPSLIFLQSEDEKITSYRLTPKQYLKQMDVPEQDIEIQYLEDLVAANLRMRTSKNLVFISTDLDDVNRKKLVELLIEKGFNLAQSPSEAEVIFVYCQDDAVNLMETQVAKKIYGDKDVFSLLDTETEVEEVNKTGAKAICIETIMQDCIQEFQRKHQRQNIPMPLEISSREAFMRFISRRIAQEILRKNYQETKKILNLLDFPAVDMSDLPKYSKPDHFTRSHSTNAGIGAAIDISIWHQELIPRTAEEIAGQYFKNPKPSKEQIRVVRLILEAGETLGIVRATGDRMQADGKRRMTYVGIHRALIKRAYKQLKIEEAGDK